MKILNKLKKKYLLLSLSTACSLVVTSMPIRVVTTDSASSKANYKVSYEEYTDMADMISHIHTHTGTTATTTFTTTSTSSTTTTTSISSSTSSTGVITTSIIPTTSATQSVTTTTTSGIVTTTSKATTLATTTTTVVTTTKPITTESPYVVYKPSTHYIHMNTCRWFDNSCKKIDTTEGLECRKCTECNPDIEIVKEYKPEVQTSSSSGLSDYDIMLLRKIVASEYGADWVPVAEKAKIVASVMAMVRNPRYPNTISGVLATACEPWGFNRNRNYYISNSTIAAVDYYFANQNTVFANWCYTSWWGDGKYNHFYC